MSRFQLLVFTFVIALSLFFIVASSEKPAFPAISDQILVLLGISGSTALVSKAIQTGSETARTALKISSATTGPLAPGDKIDLTVSVPAGTTLPSITWSLDAPAQGTLIPQPGPDKVVYQAPPAGTSLSPSEKKVTIRAKAAGFEDGTAGITLA